MDCPRDPGDDGERVMGEPMSKVSVSIPLTDAPKWLRFIEIENDGKIVTIQTIRSNGDCHVEAMIDAEKFFSLIEKLKDN